MAAALPTPGGSVNVWGTEIVNWLYVAHNADGTLIKPGVAWINVTSEAYGADPTGVADSTAAIQAAINAATGSLAPATNVRACSAAVYLPTGNYKVSSDLIIRSVESFMLIGDGPEATRIYASGTGFTQAVMFIDGAADSTFSGFTVAGLGTEGSGASPVPDGIRLDWTTAAARSTTGNRFTDVRVNTINAVTMFSMECNGGRQLDSTYCENVIVTGTQTPGAWSNTGHSQKGFAVGDGVFANNYDQVFVRCDAADLYYGTYINASSVALFGSQPGGNYCDFYVNPGAQVTIKNIQSQDSGQFLIVTGSTTPFPVSVEDVDFLSAYPVNTSPYTLITQSGSNLHVKGFFGWIYASGAFQSPSISIGGYSGTCPAHTTLENLVLQGAAQTTIVPQAGYADVVVINYTNYDVGTASYTPAAPGDLLSAYGASSWVILDQPVKYEADTTGAGGTALSTTTTKVLLTYTAPADGNLHTVDWSALLHVTTGGTGGNVITTISGLYSVSDGFSASLSAGYYTASGSAIVPPGDTFEVYQSVALSGVSAAATLFGTIFAL